MPSLRSAVLRVASELPQGDPTRRKILHALTAGAETQVVGENVRITYGDDRFGTIRIQELPSKPLKRKLDRVDYSSSFTRYWTPEFRTSAGAYHANQSSTQWLFGAENIAKLAGFSKGMTFAKAVSALKSALDKAAKEMQDSYRKVFAKGAFKYENPGTSRATLVPATPQDLAQALKWVEDNAKSAVSEDEVYFLDVEPHDYKPIEIDGKEFHGTFEWTKFTFYPTDDPSANPMEGMRTFYQSTSAGGARKLFKLMKGDPSLFERMPLDKFTKFMSENKIAFNYVPTVWR